MTALVHHRAFDAAPTAPWRIRRSENQAKQSSVFNAESALENLEMRNSEKVAGNNLSAEIGRPRAFRLTQREWRMLSSRAFREFAGDRAGAAKMIADEVECSAKTAQSWLDGESTPAGILDLRALARIPTYAALKREVAQMETTMDPRLQAKYQELHRLTLELAGAV